MAKYGQNFNSRELAESKYPLMVVIKSLLICSIYVLLFIGVPSVQIYVQVGAIGMLAMAAYLSYAKGIRKVPLSIFELICIIIIIANPIMIILNSSIGFEEAIFSQSYTFIFLIAIFSVSIISRSMSFDDAIKSISIAFLFMILTVFAFYYRDIFESLRPNASARWSLRIQAFSLHPNIEGFVFGGGSIILIRAFFQSKGFGRFSYAIGALACWMLVLAASSRGGLVAIFGSILLSFTIAIPKLNRLAMSSLVISAFIAVFGLLAYGDQVGAYFYEVLELGSEHRGLGTGGTGRLDLWAKGWELLTSDLTLMLTGRGLRAAGEEVIGFQTESSYITIFLEVGLVLGIFLIFSMLSGMMKSFYWILQTKRVSMVEIFGSCIFLNAMIESITNRYLFAIGNSFSLVIMLLFCYASQGRARREVQVTD